MAGTLRLALVLATLGLPAAAAAQGLGETAASERERRQRESQKKKAEPAPVYTNDDLDAIRPPEAESSSEDDETASETSTSRRPRRGAGSSAPGRRRQEGTSSQRDEVNRARAEVDGIEARMRELNGKLNPMSRDYIYGAAQTGDAASEELRVRAELSELEERLGQARRNLAAATEALNAAQDGRQPEFASEEPQ